MYAKKLIVTPKNFFYFKNIFMPKRFNATMFLGKNVFRVLA